MALAVLLVAGLASAEETNQFKSTLEKNSYAVGVSIGSQWKQQEIAVDYEQFLRGLKDAKDGGHTAMTMEEVQATLRDFSKEIREKYAEKQRAIAEKNKAEGEAFLLANKSKPGVITLPNNLQYKVIAEGSGESPKAEDIVEVNYRGTLVDGTEFDSNAKTGAPMTRAANQVIKGWTEALTRMKPGAKWQLFIPAELAYGERGFQGKIPPNAALIFDVELLAFKPAPPPVAPAPAQPLTSDIIKVPSLEEMKKGAKIETIKAEDVEKLQKQAQEPKK